MKRLFTILFILLTTLAKAQSGAALFWAADGPLQPTNPASIPGLLNWFRADTGVVLTGGVVTSWTNQASASNPMTVLSGANGPTLDNYGGYAALKFDGIGTALEVNNSGVSNKNTLFIVFKRNSTDFQILATSQGVPSQYFATFNSGDYQLSSPTGFIGNGLAAITITSDYADWKAYVNNTLNITYANQVAQWSSMQIGKWSGGSPYWWNGWVMEIIYYDKLLTQSEMDIVYSYLKTKYNLP